MRLRPWVRVRRGYEWDGYTSETGIRVRQEILERREISVRREVRVNRGIRLGQGICVRQEKRMRRDR